MPDGPTTATDPLADREERLLTSGMGSELVCRLYAPWGAAARRGEAQGPAVRAGAAPLLLAGRPARG